MTSTPSRLGYDVVEVGNRFRGRCAVAGEGPPLIALHGQGGHLENFSRNIAELARTHRVYAPDCVWHGLGPRPAFDDRLIPVYVEQVLDLVEAESLGPVAVLGQSMGGWTAARLAVDHPDLLSALVLTNPQGCHLPPDDDGPEVLPAPGSARRVQQQAALDDPTADSVRARLSGLVADPARIDDDTVRVRLELYSRPEVATSLRQVLQSYMGGTASPSRAFELTPRQLATITTPTLVLWGEHNSVGPRDGRRIARCIPQARFVEIADAGHWVHFEKAAEHDALVAQFLAAC